MCGAKVLRCPVTSGTLLSILQNRNLRALNGLDLFRGILYVFTSKTHSGREGNAMSMIDIYAVAGTFADPKQLAIAAANTVKTIDGVPDIPMFRKNTAAVVQEMPAGILANVEADGTYVSLEVLTNVGARSPTKRMTGS